MVVDTMKHYSAIKNDWYIKPRWISEESWWAKKKILKGYMLLWFHLYIIFFNNKILEMENKLIGCQSLGTGSGKWEGMCGYKRTTWGILVVMELSCILAMASTWTYTCNKITENYEYICTDTTHTEEHIKLGKSVP